MTSLLYSPPCNKTSSYIKNKFGYTPAGIFSPQQTKTPLDINYALLSNKNSLDSLIAMANRLTPSGKKESPNHSQMKQPSDFCLEKNEHSPKAGRNQAKSQMKTVVKGPNFIRGNRKPGVSITTKVPSPLKIIQTLNGISSTQSNHMNNRNEGQLPSMEKVYHSSEYSIKNRISKNVIEYSYKEDINKYYKESMEDKGKSIDNFNANTHNLLLTLFDGHGGDSVSNYLQANYDQFLKKRLYETHGNIVNSLHTSFLQADKSLKEFDFVHVGATGCVVYITQEGNKKVVYCANVGDTRCTFFSQSKIERLSYDHRADDPKEKQRILNNGGIVINKRVMGQLMLSRAFGDFELKSFGVKCEPYITRKELSNQEKDQFLVIASDGIWDVISEGDVQDYIGLLQSRPNDGKSISYSLCEKLIQVALSRGAWDNLSVFAVKLN